jgi:hypothetical protein
MSSIFSAGPYSAIRRSTIAMLIAALLSGCTYYQPVAVPASGPSKFDSCWNAALGAVGDAGVRVVSADRDSGVISGSTDDASVTVAVRTQADGSVRVEIHAVEAKGTDQALATQISNAYDRRMGR